MKKFSFLLCLLSIAYFSFTGGSTEIPSVSNNTSITNFYYYKGAPIPLKLKSDMIFIQLNYELSESSINSIISQVIPSASVSAYQKNDRKQIINIPFTTNDAVILNYLNALKGKPGIESASPVFSTSDEKIFKAVQNTIMVQFKESMRSGEIENFLSSRNLEIKTKLDLKGGSTYLIKTPNVENKTALDFANEIYNSGKVNWSEPDFYHSNLFAYVPNDPLVPKQWSLKNPAGPFGSPYNAAVYGVAGCDMDMYHTWNITKGSAECIIGVTDSGIDTLHEDLAQNMVPGSGYNFAVDPPIPGGMDDAGHGTACAGIIAAVGDNNKGISGIAPSCRLISAKFISSNGTGTDAGAVQSIVYCYQKGSWIINNSWGSDEGSSAVDQAVTDAWTLGRGGKGTVMCFVSGNTNTENQQMWYPAATHPKLIAVGGISPCNQRKTFLSCDMIPNWGSVRWASCYGPNLDICAPSVWIYTTIRTGTYQGGNYIYDFAGTSAACPNVAGIAALMLSVDPQLKADSVRARIDRFAVKAGDYSYNTPKIYGMANEEVGYGRVNAYLPVKYSLLQVQNFPLVPFNLQSPASGTTITTYNYSIGLTTISWAASAFLSTYKFKFKNSSGQILLTFASDTNSIAFRSSQLDSILDVHGWTANGSATDAVAGFWEVWAYTDELATNHDSLIASNSPRPMTLKRNAINLTAFHLINPVNNRTVETNLHNSAPVYFQWTNPGWGVKYKWQFASPNFSGQIIWNRPSFNVGFDTNYMVVDSMFDKMLDSIGIHRGDSIVGQWRVIGYRGNTDSLVSAETRNITFRRVNWPQLNAKFENRQFPPQDWTLTRQNGNPGSNWFRDSIHSGYGIGTGCAMFRFITSSEWHALTTERFLESTTANYLKFDYAYAYHFDQFNNFCNDSMQIYTSTNGGTNWSLLITLQATTTIQLGTNSSSNMTTAVRFYFDDPHPEEWATKFFQIPVGTNRVKFQAYPDGGNLFYMDNIETDIPTNTGQPSEILPDKFALSQNYPNPFNPVTKIRFSVPQQSFIRLKVFDLLGREVANLISEMREAGYHSVDFNASSLSSGIYIYRLEAADFIETKRMVLIK